MAKPDPSDISWGKKKDLNAVLQIKASTNRMIQLYSTDIQADGDWETPLPKKNQNKKTPKNQTKKKNKSTSMVIGLWYKYFE